LDVIFVIINWSVLGPFKVNGVPLRRVNQAYVIATSTKLDIGAVKVPEHVNDAYFRKTKVAKTQKSEADFLNDKKEVFYFNNEY